MSVQIRAHRGLRLGLEVDTTLVGVWLVERGAERRIGFADKIRGAALMLTESGISEAIIEEAKQALLDYESEELPEKWVGAYRAGADTRAVVVPPPELEDEEEDGDEDKD